MSPKTLLSGALLLGALTIATSSSAWACGCGGWSPYIQPQTLGRGVVVTHSGSEDAPNFTTAAYPGARSRSWEFFKDGRTHVLYDEVEFPTARQARAEVCSWVVTTGACHGTDIISSPGAGDWWAAGSRGRYFFFAAAGGPRARRDTLTLARYSDQLYSMVTAEAPR